MNAPVRFPEFRFFFFTTKYDETVAFYRDVLQLQVDRAWDRPDQHRGTVFTSPNGTGFIEVDDIHGWYDRVTAARATIKKSLGVTDYGHLNFKVVDPSGIEVGFFQYVS